MRGGKAESASIAIEDVAARAICPECGLEQAVAERFSPCAACGAFGLELVCGEELQVLAIAGLD
ncbi:hypothetical protein C2I19_19745 [Chromobacterium alticapitis]|uniref:Hydrogenase maturation nickel metallochaperone HypA n=1 Tax=Chromobacterium alticapitis TaxID=2073169 RepID=A0A2S5DBE7_9NEIS|nr:hypothetical protein C2I19_19745 [Chromobacterium alticapitis]